jgi:hypothetical protein
MEGVQYGELQIKKIYFPEKPQQSIYHYNKDQNNPVRNCDEGKGITSIGG